MTFVEWRFLIVTIGSLKKVIHRTLNLKIFLANVNSVSWHNQTQYMESPASVSNAELAVVGHFMGYLSWPISQFG